jgi:undecaprenyl pyrophosphate synthase
MDKVKDKVLEKTQMTVSEGLAKLKLLDKRIKKTMQMPYVGYKIGNKIQEDFDSEATKAKYQSLNDLMKYRNALKMAINESNLKTKVKVAGKKMTVLEAIEHKTLIDYKKNILEYVKRSYRDVNQKIDYGNENTQERLDAQVRSAFEKATKKEIEDFTETFLRNNGYSMEDPLDIEKLMENLDKEIDEFESEVDFVLSTSNAITTIEVKV